MTRWRVLLFPTPPPILVFEVAHFLALTQATQARPSRRERPHGVGWPGRAGTTLQALHSPAQGKRRGRRRWNAALGIAAQEAPNAAGVPFADDGHVVWHPFIRKAITPNGMERLQRSGNVGPLTQGWPPGSSPPEASPGLWNATPAAYEIACNATPVACEIACNATPAAYEIACNATPVERLTDRLTRRAEALRNRPGRRNAAAGTVTGRLRCVQLGAVGFRRSGTTRSGPESYSYSVRRTVLVLEDFMMRFVTLDHVAESFNTGSGSECVLAQDVLVVTRGIDEKTHDAGKRRRHRIIALLTKLIPRNNSGPRAPRESSTSTASLSTSTIGAPSLN